MSVSRNNWSALSRLAKQWSEDDEEEQIRERRRRTRISSNPGEKIVEVLPDEDSTPKYGNRKAKIETETPEPLKNNTVEENEGNREKPEEKLNHQHPVGKKEKGCMPDNLVEENKLTECPGDKTKDAFCKTEEMPTEEPRSKQEVQRSLRCVNQPEICQDKKDKSPTSEKEENQMSESEKKSNTMCVNRIKGKQKEELKGITHNTDEKKEEDYDQRDGRKKEIPSISSILSTTRISTVDLSTSTHPAEDLTKSNIVSSSSSGNASRYKSQVFVSSVKIQRCTSGSEGRPHILSPPPVPEEGPLHALEVAKQTDVQDPGLSSTSMSCKKHKDGGQQSDTHCVQDEFLSSAQATSSFRRFSPRTSSFRAITQNDDQVNSGRGLTRSSSLRISLRSSKLEDRLEKYTSAAQRSGSVRIPVHNRSTTGASDNIANIKSIFERDESSSGSNATNPRKDVKLPGSVSSRINQWSIKRQEGPSTNTGTKDIRTGDVAQKRNIWQQRSQSSSDTKL